MKYPWILWTLVLGIATVGGLMQFTAAQPPAANSPAGRPQSPAQAIVDPPADGAAAAPSLTDRLGGLTATTPYLDRQADLSPRRNGLCPRGRVASPDACTRLQFSLAQAEIIGPKGDVVARASLRQAQGDGRPEKSDAVL